MADRSEHVLAVEQAFEHDGHRYTYRCGRTGRGSRTRRYWVDVYDGDTVVATSLIAWNRFNGSPLTYKDYGLRMLKANLNYPDSVASQCKSRHGTAELS